MAVATALDLPHFLPFLLSRVSNAVSEALAAVYRDSAQLSLTEWRLLVVLAAQPGLSAMALGRLTLIDKVAISRALKRLLQRDLIKRTLVRSDKRQRRLRLTSAGETLYAQIAPMVLERERTLLAVLSQGERETLETLLARILAALPD